MNDLENAVQLYAWRLQDHAGSADYRRLARKIQRCSESDERSEWDDLLRAVALVETNERRLLVRVAEWTVHLLAGGRSGFTLGPFQLKNAPWKTSPAIDVLIHQCERRNITHALTDSNLSKFATFWYGHDLVEAGSALRYASALTIAVNIVRTSPPDGTG